MSCPLPWDSIDIHLIRALCTVLTERSVTRAAVRLGRHQPAVSAALRRLRRLTGDALLVRAGSGMVPTAIAQRTIAPAAEILRQTETTLAVARARPRVRHAHLRHRGQRLSRPVVLPRLVAHIKASALLARVDIQPLSGEADYRYRLAQGEVDVVIGNWPQAPDDLHQGRLFGDEVVCLVSTRYPALRRGWTLTEWLQAEHVAPTPMVPGARGTIDDHLAQQGLIRNIVVRCPHFGLIPALVRQSLLVPTTGRQYCPRFVDALPVAIVAPPLRFPRLLYYQLWHERTHASPAAQWLRQAIRDVAAGLCDPAHGGQTPLPSVPSRAQTVARESAFRFTGPDTAP